MLLCLPSRVAAATLKDTTACAGQRHMPGGWTTLPLHRSGLGTHTNITSHPGSAPRRSQCRPGARRWRWRRRRRPPPRRRRSRAGRWRGRAGRAEQRRVKVDDERGVGQRHRARRRLHQVQRRRARRRRGRLRGTGAVWVPCGPRCAARTLCCPLCRHLCRANHRRACVAQAKLRHPVRLQHAQAFVGMPHASHTRSCTHAPHHTSSLLGAQHRAGELNRPAGRCGLTIA